AVLISPVMRSLGIEDLQGHLFLLYFAVMSALTPPVAVAAYAASAIADENPLKIAAQSVKIAIGAFLIPFCFVYNPALLLQGSPWEIVYTTVSAIAGLVMVAIAVEGYWKRALPGLVRLAFLAAGLLFLAGGYLMAGVALALVAGGAAFARATAPAVAAAPKPKAGE
ncbi:MAG: TRAP transporter large permease subunit, partial [Notoacmeibacter sp.]|nr:TRAP transporter large permease subunit [Notoacmeibacter sp.]